MKCSARKVSLPGAEKHKKLAEPLAPQAPSTRLWPQLLARKGPSGPQNEIWVPVPCEAQDNIHLSSSHTKSVQNNLKISSHGITESALLGISWPKKHSGRAGRVRQFPSFQMPGHHQLPLALPAQPSHRCLLCHLLQDSSCQQGVLGGLRAICIPDLQAYFLVGPSPLSV